MMSKNSSTADKKNTGADVLSPYVPPDGGWGWIVTIASFIIATLVAIPSSGFGLIFSSFFLKHETSSTTIAWIYNANHFVWSISGILGGPLCAHFGWKNVVAISGTLVPTAIILSGFVSRPEYLYVTYSLLAGLGQGLSLMSSLIAVPKYFEKRRGIAMGISSSGICAGQFLGPLLASYLTEHYGYWGTTLILGGILFNISVAGLVLHPVEWHSASRDFELQPVVDTLKNEESEKNNNLREGANDDTQPHTLKDKIINQKLINQHLSFNSSTWSVNSSAVVALTYNSDQNNSAPSSLSIDNDKFSIFVMMKSIFTLVLANFKLLRWHRVKIMALAYSLFITSSMNFIMIVPFSMFRDGQPLQLVSCALSLAGFSNMVARLMAATLTDILPFSTRTYCIIGTLGTFITMNAFTVVLQKEWLMVIMCAFGFSAGTCMGLLSLTIIEFMGLENLPYVLGVEGFCVSIFYLVLGPILGLLRDLTGSYIIVAWISSLVTFGSTISWLLLPFAVAIDKEKQKAKDLNKETII